MLQPENDTVYALQKAYLSLVQSNKEKRVNVTDVVLQANLSRGTFYIYYDSIESLKKDIQQRLFDEMEQQKLLTEGGRDALRKQIDRLGNYTLTNRDAFYAFLVSDRDMVFIEEYKRFIKKNIINFRKGSRELNGTALEYISIATVSLVTYWMENPGKEDIKLLNKLLIDLVLNPNI